MTATTSGRSELVSLPQGQISYRESGEGAAIVFVHGLLVNGLLWRKVVPLLEGQARCIVPNWPLGSHSHSMPHDADLSPPGLARMVDDFMGALDLRDVTLVGNDTGGAISQLVAANHPDRIGRLVLTPCDAYENFLPPFFRPLQAAARVPGLLTAAIQPLRWRPVRGTPLAFGWLMKRQPPAEVTDAWVRPFLSDRGVRRDTAKVLRGISNRYTLDAAEKLRRFDRPVLIAWAPEDRFFRFKYAERLADDIPGARLERIEDSYTFVPEDQPERLAELIRAFMAT